MPLRRVVRTALVLALSIAASGALGAQGRANAPAAVTLMAHAAPRLTLVELTPPAMRSTGDTTHITRRITTDANVARALVLRRAGTDPSQALEVRDHRGAWVPLDANDMVVALESEQLGRLTQMVECRVTVPAAGVHDCPLAYELISRNPLFPMRVTAGPAATLAGR